MLALRASSRAAGVTVEKKGGGRERGRGEDTGSIEEAAPTALLTSSLYTGGGREGRREEYEPTFVHVHV